MTINQQDGWEFLVMWEFVVRPGKEKVFEEIYGPEGEWARCFRKGQGYIRTELSRDLSEPRRYVTLDFWESQADYENFKSQHGAEYKAIDQKCEALTEQEKETGKFANRVQRTRN